MERLNASSFYFRVNYIPYYGEKTKPKFNLEVIKMMNKMVRSMVQIAGGIVIGELASKTVKKVGQVASAKVKEIKNSKKG